MNAAIFAGPEKIELRVKDPPDPKPGFVVVKTYGTNIQSGDCRLRTYGRDNRRRDARRMAV